MAITEIAEFGRALQYRRFIGLSGDSKPTTNVPIGSTFLETDKLREFIYDGSAWKAKDTGGQYTTPAHTAPSIGTTTTLALAANANRLYALLVNDSDTTIYFKLGEAAVLNTGIRLNANGGSYEISKELGNLYTGIINAIHGGTGSKVLLVAEGV